MAVSTESTVRGVIVAAMRGIAVSGLGFEQQNGKIHEYLLEFENREKSAEYLMAMVAGRNVVRAWGVQVLGNDDWFATRDVTQRTYAIEIVGYYGLDVEGVGINALIDGARAVRGAIRALGSRLSETVDMVTSTSQVDAQVLRFEDAASDVVVGRMRYAAVRRRPDF